MCVRLFILCKCFLLYHSIVPAYAHACQPPPPRLPSTFVVLLIRPSSLLLIIPARLCETQQTSKHNVCVCFFPLFIHLFGFTCSFLDVLLVIYTTVLIILTDCAIYSKWKPNSSLFFHRAFYVCFYSCPTVASKVLVILCACGLFSSSKQ